MPRHGTRIVAAYICALSSSPTEDYDDLESVYRKIRGRGITYGMYSSHTCMYLVRTYTVLDESLIDAWCLASYYAVDSIGYKGRTCYNKPVVTSKVEINAAYTTRTLLHTKF